ncbi:fetal and adult testis-expressed transcript protein [Suncus etruscus]|uniref:fetal and adult testis-expressed transcript protein n=1 Tax=Suncus etruscus TaxID=109475 RepID=UPI00210FA023|nr:fetal and adult testis-expressed transcript protein [Suncus etruscus]
MAGGPLNVKDEMDLPKEEEEKTPASPSPIQMYQPMMGMDRGTQSLSTLSQRRQKVDSKVPVPASSQQSWNVNVPKIKKGVSQLPRMLRDTGHSENPAPEAQVSLQSWKYPPERRAEAEKAADSGTEECGGGLELDIIKRQLQMITRRLQELEEQGATWRQRDVLMVTVLVTACIANLWLWIRQ